MTVPSQRPTPLPLTAVSRDRHGRGLRGPLLPPSVPAHRSRREQFEDMVVQVALRAASALTPPDRARLQKWDLRVEDVPAAADLHDTTDVVLADNGIDAEKQHYIVVYRKPVEERAQTPEELEEMVHVVVVQQLASVLNVSPHQLDPQWPDDHS